MKAYGKGDETVARGDDNQRLVRWNIEGYTASMACMMVDGRYFKG